MSSIQVIRFPRRWWAFDEANQWVFSHGFAPIKVSVEGNRWNFRLEDPSHFDHFASRIVHSRASERPIHLVFGFRTPGFSRGFED